MPQANIYNTNAIFMIDIYIIYKWKHTVQNRHQEKQLNVQI